MTQPLATVPTLQNAITPDNPSLPAPAAVTTPLAAPPATPPVAPVATQPPTIAADTITNPTSLYTLPEAPTTPNYAASLSSVPTIESIVANTVGATTPAKTAQTDLQSRILGVLSQLTGKTAAQTDAEKTAGLPDLNSQLNDVNGQIQTLQKEASAAPLQTDQEFEGTGATTAGVAPVTNAVLRANTIKALGLSAIAQTLQGNITLAQAQADKAVSVEFDPLQSELTYLQSALQFNTDDMSDDEKNQATELTAELNDRQSQLDQAKSDRTTTLGYVLSAGQNGAPASVLAQAQSMAPGDALTLLQPYLKTAAKPITVAPGDTVFDPETGKPIYVAPAKATGGDGGTFTTTQVNNGASNAGTSIADFKDLDADTKNYFINGMSNFTALQKQVTSGETTAAEAAQFVHDSVTVPEGAKPYLYKILGVPAPADTSADDSSQSGIGAIGGGVGNFFKGAAKGVLNFLGI